MYWQLLFRSIGVSNQFVSIGVPTSGTCESLWVHQHTQTVDSITRFILCLSYYIHFGTTFQTFYFHQFSHTWTPTHVMFSLILFSIYEFFLVDNLSECHTYIQNVSVIDNYANMCRNSLLLPLLISSNEVHVPLRTPSLVWPAGSFCVLTHWSSLPSCLVQFALVVQMVLYELAVWCHQLEPLPSQSSASLYTSRLLLFRRCCDNVGAAAQLLR